MYCHVNKFTGWAKKTALQTHGRYSVNSNQSNINELIYKNTKTPKDRQIRTLAANPLEIYTYTNYQQGNVSLYNTTQRFKIHSLEDSLVNLQ